MFPSNFYQNVFKGVVCKISAKICELPVSLIADSDTSPLNHARVSVFMGHYPSGSSFKGFEHFGQMMLEGKFQRYDYGKELNQEKYGSIHPPEINLSNIKGMKIAQFVGTVDNLATVEDNRWLHQQLGANSVFY